MAEKKTAVKLDRKLMEDGVIDPKFEKDYAKVHDFLNKNVRKYDKALGDADFATGEKDLRSWLVTLYKQGASQEKLTGYLRCGLAHLCFDFIDLKKEEISSDQLVTRALQSFRKRHYDRTFFKPSGK